MNIQISNINIESYDLWDKIVDESPHGTVFHLSSWLKIIEKHTKTKLYMLMGFKDQTPIGIYPIFVQKKGPFNLVFSPPPKAAIPHLGPVIIGYEHLKQNKKESLYKDFQKQIDDFILKNIKASYVSIHSSPGIVDSRPLKWFGYQIDPMYTYLLDLNIGESELWNRIEKQLRNDIKRSEKKGIYIEKGNRNDITFLYDNFAKRYKEQNKVPTIEKEYLEDLWDNTNCLNIFNAKFDGKTISSLILICYKNRASVWIGVPKTNFMGAAVNDQLQWETIIWAIKNHYEVYELMGANTENLCSFKSKYNPELEVYFSAILYKSYTSKILERFYNLIFKPIHAKYKNLEL